MDHSGSNRYELLFIDDDAGTHAQPAETAPKQKKQTAANNATTKKATTAANKKTSPNAEKENKSGALNKNDANKKITGAPQTSSKGSQGAPGAATNNNNKNRPNVEGGENRKVAFKTQNGEGREQRNNRRNFRESGGGGATNEFANEQREPRQFRDRDNRGGPPRNREGGFRKREFDRQSGSDKTGVKAVDKRDGAGAHNWGSVKQEIEDMNKSANETEITLTDKEESSNEQSPEQPAAPEEEETKEMTLDEWKAMRGERSKPQYNLRKPNEGEDTSEWKKMIVLNKNKKKGEESSEEELEYDPSMYPQRVGRLQRIMDIQFNFNDGRRGGFGRGRGRGNRSGGGGADKPQRVDFGRAETAVGGARQRYFGDRQIKRGQVNTNFKVDDERQFPTLS
uniref:Hyaluronan/mRNA-binding protein domain-containing protein n=1 Tax=Glossina palpalis gambiensis TaxID=67801 RepID=A0A1B0BB52_9MUSC